MSKRYPDTDDGDEQCFVDLRATVKALRRKLSGYRALHDGLSDMIEGGRLTEGMIPDDYQWLGRALARNAGRDPGTPRRRK